MGFSEKYILKRFKLKGNLDTVSTSASGTNSASDNGVDGSRGRGRLRSGDNGKNTLMINGVSVKDAAKPSGKSPAISEITKPSNFGINGSKDNVTTPSKASSGENSGDKVVPESKDGETPEGNDDKAPERKDKLSFIDLARVVTILTGGEIKIRKLGEKSPEDREGEVQREINGVREEAMQRATAASNRVIYEKKARKLAKIGKALRDAQIAANRKAAEEAANRDAEQKMAKAKEEAAERKEEEKRKIQSNVAERTPHVIKSAERDAEIAAGQLLNSTEMDRKDLKKQKLNEARKRLAEEEKTRIEAATKKAEEDKINKILEVTREAERKIEAAAKEAKVLEERVKENIEREELEAVTLSKEDLIAIEGAAEAAAQVAADAAAKEFVEEAEISVKAERAAEFSSVKAVSKITREKDEAAKVEKETKKTSEVKEKDELPEEEEARLVKEKAIEASKAKIRAKEKAAEAENVEKEAAREAAKAEEAAREEVRRNARKAAKTAAIAEYKKVYGEVELARRRAIIVEGVEALAKKAYDNEIAQGEVRVKEIAFEASEEGIERRRQEEIEKIEDQLRQNGEGSSSSSVEEVGQKSENERLSQRLDLIKSETPEERVRREEIEAVEKKIEQDAFNKALELIESDEENAGTLVQKARRAIETAKQEKKGIEIVSFKEKKDGKEGEFVGGFLEYMVEELPASPNN